LCPLGGGDGITTGVFGIEKPSIVSWYRRAVVVLAPYWPEHGCRQHADMTIYAWDVTEKLNFHPVRGKMPRSGYDGIDRCC